MSLILTEDSADIQAELQSHTWAKRIAERLELSYPGYGWAVHADVKNNIAQVRALKLAGEYGFTLHIDKLDPHDKQIKWAGGEILERYKVSRSRMKEDELLNKSRDLRGNVIGDVS